jgi:hypothetical protein
MNWPHPSAFSSPKLTQLRKYGIACGIDIRSPPFPYPLVLS